VQVATKRAVDNVGAITSVMSYIDSFTRRSARAMNQQNTAAIEISENIRQAAAGTASVAQRIAGTAAAKREYQPLGRSGLANGPGVIAARLRNCARRSIISWPRRGLNYAGIGHRPAGAHFSAR